MGYYVPDKSDPVLVSHDFETNEPERDELQKRFDRKTEGTEEVKEEEDCLICRDTTAPHLHYPVTPVKPAGELTWKLSSILDVLLRKRVKSRMKP